MIFENSEKREKIREIAQSLFRDILIKIEKSSNLSDEHKGYMDADLATNVCIDLLAMLVASLPEMTSQQFANECRQINALVLGRCMLYRARSDRPDSMYIERAKPKEKMN